MGAGASVPAPGESDKNNNPPVSSQHPPTPAILNNAQPKAKTDSNQAAVSSPVTSYRCQIKAPAWTEIPVTDCVLAIGKESLFIRDASSGAPIRDVPFHEIVCWGYNQNSLEVRLFGTMFQREKGHTVDVLFPTSEGSQIAVKLFEAVQALKKKIDSHNLSSEDFDTLLVVLREDKTRAQQKELQILRSFGGARQIQSTQVRTYTLSRRAIQPTSWGIRDA